MDEILKDDHESLLGQRLQLRIQGFEWVGGSYIAGNEAKNNSKPFVVGPILSESNTVDF